MTFAARATRVKPALLEIAGKYTRLNHGRGPCPIHHGEGDNFAVRGDYFRCFACGASGDVIDLVSKAEGISRKDALKALEADLGLSAEVSKDEVVAIAKLRQEKVQEVDRRSHQWIALVQEKDMVERDIARYAMHLSEGYRDDHAAANLAMLYDDILDVENRMDEFLDS